MKINSEWLFRLYQNEAGADGGDGGGGADVGQGGDDNQNNNEDNNQGNNERPEWLLEKYATEGKSTEEATQEQAKAYTELSKKFGSFTGAPENYELSLSEELKEAGIEIDSKDPLIESAMEFAKNSNMSQEGFNGMVELYAMQQLANQKANEEYVADQLKQLGNSESRIKNINDWANKNLDAESVAGLQSVVTTAEGVKAIEQIIAKTRNASVDADDTQNNSGASAEEVRKMQFEKDQHGNRKINTDPEFRKRYQKLRDEVYGTGEHREMIG